MLKKIGIGIFALISLAVLVLAGAIAFFPPQQPPAIEATSQAAVTQMAEVDDIAAAFADLPPLSRMDARDGVALAYRFYQGAPGGSVAVLIHGSSGRSQVMHLAAKALAQSGVSVVVPDMRGHGESGARRGDIDYLGQLDDDMADVADMLAARFPGERRLLIGHSSGGGFVLRVAGGASGDKFDGYIALAPYLGSESPTVRPQSGGWAGVSVPRILGLIVLGGFGVHAFDGLPTLAFALEPGTEATQTPTYSYRLMSNFGLPYRGWEDMLRAIERPITVIVAGEDEMFVPDQFAPVLHALNHDIEVRMAPGVRHMGMVVTPAALDALVAAARDLR